MTEKENKFQITFQKLSPKPGDLFIVRVPPQFNTEQMNAFAAEVRPFLPKETSLMVIHIGVELFQLSEEAMSKEGWYRFKPTDVVKH